MIETKFSAVLIGVMVGQIIGLITILLIAIMTQNIIRSELKRHVQPKRKVSAEGEHCYEKETM